MKRRTRVIDPHLPLTAPLLVVLAALTAACGDAPEGAGWTFTTDTLPGGAILTVNTPPAEGEEALTWWVEEELRIGAVDDGGPASFGEVRDFAPLDDGGVAVLESQAQEVRIFDAGGNHVRTFGGEGEGPGELRAAFGLMVSPEGDLWVPDHRNARMSVFDADSGFVESLPLELMTRGYIWAGVMTPEGRVLKPSITRGETRSPVLRVFDSRMELVDSLPLRPRPVVDRENPPNSFFYELSGGGFGYRSVPFYPAQVRTVDPRGDVWATAFGDPAYRIVRWRPGGDTTLVIETARPPVPVTQDERDSAIAAVRAGLEESGASVQQDWSKIPETKPAVMGMFLSEDGRLWVRRPSSDGLTHYDVYERDGRRVGGAATSLRLYPYLSPVVSGDVAWALVSDDLDIPYVVRARVIPAECRVEGAAGCPDSEAGC